MGLIEMVEKELLRQAEEKGKVEGLKEGKIKGIREGKVRGINEEQESNIAKLLLHGFSVEEVAKLLEKPTALVKTIFDRLNKEGKLQNK